jgi:hypothetical protein
LRSQSKSSGVRFGFVAPILSNLLGFAKQHVDRQRTDSRIPRGHPGYDYDNRPGFGDGFPIRLRAEGRYLVHRTDIVQLTLIPILVSSAPATTAAGARCTPAQPVTGR